MKNIITLKTSEIQQYEKDHHYYEACNIENAYNNTVRKNRIKLLLIFFSNTFTFMSERGKMLYIKMLKVIILIEVEKGELAFASLLYCSF